MPIKLIIFVACLFMYISSSAQGSGNALSFNGTANFVNLPANPVSTFNNFTIEAWVNWNSTNQWERIFDFGNNTNVYMFLTPKSSANFPRYAITTSGNGSEQIINSSIALATNSWHHIAISYTQSTTTGIMYIDGVQVGSNTSMSLRPSSLGATSNNWIGKSQYAVDAFFNGRIDEFRIWNVARTQTQIRDFMTQKVVGNETGLRAAYRMDEASGTNLTNTSSNAGSLASATFAASTPTRVTSGAAIGDASAYNYPGSWTGQTVSLSSTSNGSLTVSTVTGSPNGIHIFRVDGVPNSTTGVVGIGTNDTYFGTFIVGGTSPTYTAVYDYSSYPEALINESSNALYIRGDNSAGSWSASGATLTTATNKLTLTGISVRDEFILGNTTVPLPLTLLTFKAISSSESENIISWTAADQSRLSFYEVERSSDGNNFESIAKLKASVGTSSYECKDGNGFSSLSYYRLKIVEQNGDIKYSTVVACTNTSSIDQVFVYPVPFSDYLTISSVDGGTEINIIDMKGRLVHTQISSASEFIVHTDLLESGLYTLQIKRQHSVVVKRIFKN